MRLIELARAVQELQTQVAGMTKILDELARKIADERERPDPFAAHLYQARRAYRRALDTTNKDGKKIERTVNSTYRDATLLGFKGNTFQWQELLRLGA